MSILTVNIYIMHAAMTQGCQNHLYFVFETIKFNKNNCIQWKSKEKLFLNQRLHRYRHYHIILLHVQSLNLIYNFTVLKFKMKLCVGLTSHKPFTSAGTPTHPRWNVSHIIKLIDWTVIDEGVLCDWLHWASDRADNSPALLKNLVSFQFKPKSWTHDDDAS